MLDHDFPPPAEAPPELRGDGACGLLSAWQVLCYFNRHSDVRELVRACRYDPDVGVYAIGLAVALARAGLVVEFHSEPDPNPEPVERELYSEAAAFDIVSQPAISIAEVGERLELGAVALILYEAENGSAHFTPILSVDENSVVAPNEGGLEAAVLEERRRRPGILRQCVLASGTLPSNER
jgi:hypothetical protein